MKPMKAGKTKAIKKVIQYDCSLSIRFIEVRMGLGTKTEKNHVCGCRYVHLWFYIVMLQIWKDA